MSPENKQDIKRQQLADKTGDTTKKTDKKIHDFLYGRKHSVRFYKIAQKIEDTFFNPETNYDNFGGDSPDRRNTIFHRYHYDYKGTKHTLMMIALAPLSMVIIILGLIIAFLATH